ncbi:MAG: glycosyltransferase family 4 protein [Chlamydiota bacterium]
MKSALVHDWLVSIGGGEKVLQALSESFPSPIYTLVQNKKGIAGSFFENQEIITSFIQKLPFASTKYRNYLPFFPLAIEQFDLSSYDLILSSSHAVAKGILTHAEQLHICYCHTPMRYAWDLYHHYLQEMNLHKGIKGKIAKTVLHYLRQWDQNSASRVDAFIANSHYIAKRIKKTYGKEATVIYPPVDTLSFSLETKKEPFYLTASRMVPYKKIDLIVEAFASMPDKKLVVIGDGPEFSKIKSKAKKNIELLGYQPDAVLKQYLQKAKAFVFAAREDFGILPVEAQCSGTPVIAYGKGGVLETVIPHQTGLFFHEQTQESLYQAIQEFEKTELDPLVIRKNALRFSKERFTQEIQTYVKQKYEEFLQ